jgi:indole-3-glycerol phosphate synthase
MDILRSIVEERRRDVQDARARIPEERLRAQAAARRDHRSLAAALRAGTGTRIIAEMKRASPSAGTLREDYHPADIARRYAGAGACALSVLTEPRHFRGDPEDLRAARAAADLPVLRKDFLCDPYQVWEAAAWGADAVLLIVAAVAPDSMAVLYREALAGGLDVLAEAHTEDEVGAALRLDRAIVGVNSRDLRTLKTDLAVARRLAGLIPDDRLCVAESGIRTRADVVALEACGYDGFLVGETLLRAGDPPARLRELRGRPPECAAASGPERPAQA